MKKINLKLYLGICILLLSLFSCRKDPNPDEDEPVTTGSFTEIYILNEGLFNMNNTTLSYYNSKDKTIENNYFQKLNGRGLGDTGNDMKLYGGKLYCVMNVSNQIEVIDIYSGKSLKQIPLKEGSVGRQPRNITFFQNNAYVCCFDGSVVRIDTATLEVDAIVKAGKNPEDLCIANNKLYVTNSGGLDNPNYDSTVSVINLTTFSEIKKINIGKNPSAIRVDDFGDIYVISRGDYKKMPSCLQRIDTRTDELVQTFDIKTTDLTIHGNYAYMYYYDFSTSRGNIMVFDVISEKIIQQNFIADGTNIKTPYGIMVDPLTEDVYITDARNFTENGDVYCFDKNGKQKFNFAVGLNPNSIVLHRK